MNIAAERKALISQFSEVQDLAVIRAIKSMLSPQKQSKTKPVQEIKQPLYYTPETIELNGTEYILNYPLRRLFEKEEGY